MMMYVLSTGLESFGLPERLTQVETVVKSTRTQFLNTSMAGKTTTYTDAVLNLMRGSNQTAFTGYLGLFSANPADDGSAGTELSGSGYARQSITFGAPSDHGSGGRKVQNTNTIRFGPAASDWSAAVGFGIWDASTSGNLKYWGTMTSVTVLASSSLEVAIGDLTVRED